MQDLRAVLKEVHERNKGVSEKEVVRDATQAIAELLDRTAENIYIYITEDILQKIQSVLLEKDHLRSRLSYNHLSVERFIQALRARFVMVIASLHIQVIERGPKMDRDNRIYVPVSIAQKRLFATDYVSSISVEVKTKEEMESAQKELGRSERERLQALILLNR